VNSLSVPYFPEVFIPGNLDHAKAIILADDPKGEKWVKETEETASQIIQCFAQAGRPLQPGSVLLDYGCGVGRVSKRLIELTGCVILGLDFSPRMLEFAIPYVGSPGFVPCPPQALPILKKQGLQIQGAIAVLVLQHCLNPRQDIELIASVLEKDALFFVANSRGRYVPTTPKDGWAQWHDDGLDVRKEVLRSFELVSELASDNVSDRALFKKPNRLQHP
jgi:SAM-dependent methyltransferase